MKTVFVCGTGRCGTTITKKVLANHPEIFAFSDEARFINCPHFVLDLFRNLTSEWTPLRAETALREFERSMVRKRSRFRFGAYRKFVNLQSKRRLFSLISPPSYMSLDIRHHSDIIKKHLTELKKDLGCVTYEGCWPGMPGFIIRPRMTISTVIQEEHVAEALNKFLTNFLSEILSQQGASVWLDDSNYVHLGADNLFKILPLSKLIHVYRDPRDVVSSFMTRLWAPPTPLQAAKLYKATMDRWCVIKKELPENSYLEVCFEKLADNPKKELSRICEFINLPWHDDLLRLKLSKSNKGRWQRDLSKDDLEAIEPYVGYYLDHLHYR